VRKKGEGTKIPEPLLSAGEKESCPAAKGNKGKRKKGRGFNLPLKEETNKDPYLRSKHKEGKRGGRLFVFLRYLKKRRGRL